MFGFLGLVFDAAIAVLVLWFLLHDVTRARLERFAKRQLLVITPANGQRVIGYLATKRRWRLGGLLAGLAITAACKYTRHGHMSVGGAGAFLGWLLGAIAAEWRVSMQPTPGARRVASLAVRRLGDYVARWFVILTLAVWAATLALAVSELVWVRSGRLVLLAELAVVLLVAITGWAVVRRILTRPQFAAALDVVEADDAIRSRSLHVLLGSVLAITAVLAGLIDTAANTFYRTWIPDPWHSLLDSFAAFVLPLVALLGATEPFRTRRRSNVALGVTA